MGNSLMNGEGKRCSGALREIERGREGRRGEKKKEV